MAQHIAIVSALHAELAEVLSLMPDEHKRTVGGRTFWSGHLHGHEVVATLSGMGKVAAATTTSLLIDHFKAEQIIFTGVAGGLGSVLGCGTATLAGRRTGTGRIARGTASASRTAPSNARARPLRNSTTTGLPVVAMASVSRPRAAAVSTGDSR